MRCFACVIWSSQLSCLGSLVGKVSPRIWVLWVRNPPTVFFEKMTALSDLCCFCTPFCFLLRCWNGHARRWLWTNPHSQARHSPGDWPAVYTTRWRKDHWAWRSHSDHSVTNNWLLLSCLPEYQLCMYIVEEHLRMFTCALQHATPPPHPL